MHKHVGEQHHDDTEQLRGHCADGGQHQDVHGRLQRSLHPLVPQFVFRRIPAEVAQGLSLLPAPQSVRDLRLVEDLREEDMRQIYDPWYFSVVPLDLLFTYADTLISFIFE